MYQRIYNKKLHTQNGTLIDNWFEEEELRKRTGVTRATPMQNFPRKFCDFENPIKNPNPGDDTFKRIINDEIFMSVQKLINKNKKEIYCNCGNKYTIKKNKYYSKKKKRITTNIELYCRKCNIYVSMNKHCIKNGVK